MAKNVNIETIKLKLEDFGKLRSVGETFNKLNKSLSFTDDEIKATIKSVTSFDQKFKDVNKTSVRSVATYNKQIAALKELQNNVAIGGKAYKAFGAEADRLRAQLEALTGTAQKQKGFLGGKLGAGATAAIGGAGAYIGQSLGISPAISGLASAGAAASKAAGGSMLAGGLQGAAVGAGLTAIAGGAKFASESATYAAEIQKLQIALKGVTKTQTDFTKGLDVIANTSKKLNVPIAASTKQFTTLAASVLGSGGTIEDAEEVFTGVSNAIKATGGNAEDVQSAIRAMSQIFGKGKVSAEELQGQLGERLAGAVVKFADANGSSLQKLQKDLRDGVVGLDQIMNFAKKLNLDFKDIAEEVANSSADAGQRLQTSMDRLKLAVGTILQPIGAAFQRVFGNIVDAITGAIEAFNRFMGIGLGNAIKKTESAIESLNKQIKELEDRGNDKLAGKKRSRLSQLERDLEELKKGLGEEGGNKTSNLPDATTPPDQKTIDQYLYTLGEITKEELEIRNLKGESLKIMEGLKAAGIDFTLTQDQIIEKLKGMKKETKGFKKQFKELYDSVTDLNTNLSTYAVGAIDRLADSFVDLMVTGKASFKELARSILIDIQKMILKAILFQTIFSPLKKFLNLEDGGALDKGEEIEPSAKGNVFAKNKIVPYAMGGIVKKPTIFPMKDGLGLMGEAGAEAVMPLKRTRQGKLGVEASGGGGNVVNVSVDASGTSAQGNTMKANQLGKLIGAAIEAELVKQKRPGGILYS